MSEGLIPALLRLSVDLPCLCPGCDEVPIAQEFQSQILHRVFFFTCHLPEQLPALGIFLTANRVVEEINVYTARWIYHWSKSGGAGEK